MLQIPQEARLIDGGDRSQPHRHRGELPELRHQPRMGIRRQPLPRRNLVAEPFQMILRQAAFQKRAGINARRSVPLKIDQIAQLRFIPCAEEMVEADFIQRGRRRVRRNMPADARMIAVGPHHHRHRVPADDALQPAFDLPVAGKPRLIIDRDGVDVRRIGRERNHHAAKIGPLGQHAEQLLHPIGSMTVQYVVQ